MDYKQEYLNKILSAIQYHSKIEPMTKRFSASMLGSDDLVNYLRYKHGIIKEKDKIDQTAFGSIYQLGMDKIFEKDNQYDNALSLSYELSNGWLITGEIDQYDKVNRVIFDNKLINESGITSTKKDQKDSSYGLQLGVYSYLLYKNYGYEAVDTVLAVANKQFSHFKKNKEPEFELYSIKVHEPQVIEEMLIEKTNRLDEYIKNNETPNECSTLFWFNKNGRNVKMKCLYYCDYRDVCPYNKTSHRISKDDIFNLL
jgi:hypothetical protein